MIGTTLKEVDKIEVTILVDNYIDIFLEQHTEIDRRPGFSTKDICIAEHGFACIIKVFKNSEKHLILMDTGFSSNSLLHNSEALNINLEKIESLVLSHGHFDHIGGIIDFMKHVDGIPLVLHPDAFLERRLNNPNVNPIELPQLDKEILKNAGAEIIKSKDSSLIASDLILVTGEVERKTHFEKGFPWAEAKINDKWVLDPINDDQAIVINLKNKGLVIISGCAHSGIINTIKYAKKITQKDKVHAVLGGFHLTGPLFEDIIQPTIDEIKNINPDYVVPMHCTGWDAINQFKEEMDDKVILNTIGTTYIFE